MQKHDIAIVGAGPCGSLLAFLLAEAGRDVVILEKARHPRRKPCGGGITPKVSKILPPFWKDSIEDVCHRASLCYRRTLDLEWPEPVCYMVQRHRFDSQLCVLAKRAGAVLLEDTHVRHVESGRNHVTLHTDRGEVLAGMVVGADGAHSRVAGVRKGGRHAFGAVTEVFPAKEELEGTRGRVAVDFSVISGGYGWVFPKGDHLNVGVYTIYPQTASIASGLDRYLMKLGLKGRPEANRRAFPIPLWTRNDQVVARDRILLVGDAAALADPLTGEGVYAGCWSAVLAAESIFKHGDNHRAAVTDYAWRVKQEIEPQLRNADRLAFVFYRYLPFVMSYVEKRRELARDFWQAVFLGEQGKLRPKYILWRIVTELYSR